MYYIEAKRILYTITVKLYPCMGVRYVALFAVLVFVNLPAVAFAQLSSCPGIHDGFEDIPPRTYEIAVIHDENMNGKLDTKWLGS